MKSLGSPVTKLWMAVQNAENGVVWGARSWAIPPFDRAHTTSYSTLIETMCLYFTVFEIQPVICRKSTILTHPTCIWRPRGGDSDRISRRSSASENQSPWAIVWRCLCDPTFSRFSRTPTCNECLFASRIIVNVRNSLSAIYLSIYCRL